MSLRVLVTPEAAEQMFDCARFIAVERQSPETAEVWLGRVLASKDELSEFPRRGPVCAESEHLGYELRRLILGNYFMLYTVDDASGVVWVVGFRHASRLLTAEDLPPQPPAAEL